MKIKTPTNIILSVVSYLIFIPSALAQLTIQEATYTDAARTMQTYKVSGTGDISDFGSTLTYKSIWLYGGNITLNDSSKTLSITGTAESNGALSVLNGSAWYAIVAQGGTNSITIKDGGNISIIRNNNSISLNNASSTLAINIEESAGNVSIKKAFTNQGKLTLNLSKENALYTDGSTVPVVGISNGDNNSSFTLNTSKNQTLGLDLRTGTRAYFNITDGAIITVTSATQSTLWNDKAATIYIDNGLTDGGILFSNSSSIWNEDSWDSETSSLLLTTTSSEKTHTFKFVDSAGNPLTNLNWITTSDGFLLTAVPEPAEWAAIFGLAALILAFGKRRLRK